MNPGRKSEKLAHVSGRSILSQALSLRSLRVNRGREDMRKVFDQKFIIDADQSILMGTSRRSKLNSGTSSPKLHEH